MEKKQSKAKAQWTVDDLYVPPFTKQRSFNEQTRTTAYEPFSHERVKTGVTVLDGVVDLLIAGRNPRWHSREWGMTHTELNRALQALTGLSTLQFVMRWRGRLAEDLLRYTNLPTKDIQRRCGYKSQPTFSNFVRQQLGLPPLHFRKIRRQPGDLGKYAL